MASDPSAARDDREWFIVGRWQEYEGEARANLLRIAGIGAFYREFGGRCTQRRIRAKSYV